jgi:predicted MFS family arabinose efflux permease
LLVPVSSDLAISEAQAGWLLTAYALGYAVLSPLLVSATGQIGRRRILAFGTAVFALAALICALAPNATILFAARFLAAAGAGLVTPVAASVAAGLSAPERRARALAVVFFGMTLSQVFGVPVGSWLAYTFGWRSAFVVVAILSLPVIWLIWTRVPAGLSFAPVSLRDLRKTLTNLQHMLAISFTTFFLGGIYVVYTYLAPLLREDLGYERDGVTLTLLIYGLGAVVGNLVGGALSDKIGPTRTLGMAAAAQIVLLPVFSFLPANDIAFFAFSVVWAICGWSFMSAQQVRLISFDAPNAPVFLALNAAAIYVGAALGSALGGWAISSFGLNSLGWIGGMTACGALVVLILSERLHSQNSA